MESQDVLAPSNFKVAHEMTVTFTSEEIHQSSFFLDPCSVVQITRLASQQTGMDGLSGLPVCWVHC